MSKMAFSIFERDGLMYISPLPSCNSSHWWQKAMARVVLWGGNLKRKFTRILRYE